MENVVCMRHRVVRDEPKPQIPVLRCTTYRLQGSRFQGVLLFKSFEYFFKVNIDKTVFCFKEVAFNTKITLF